MIQRIQSIFLFLVVVAMSLAIFLPIWGEENANTKERIEMNAIEVVQTTNGQITAASSTVYLAALAGFVAVLALWNIFNYKNRRFQMKIGFLTTLLIVVFIGIASYVTYVKDDIIPAETGSAYGLGYFMPVVAVLASQLAVRFINRDDKMVRSADRLR